MTTAKEPEGVRMILWAPGDVFICRNDRAELQLKRSADKLIGSGPYYPACPWCGASMDIVALNKEADSSQEKRATE